MSAIVRNGVVVEETKELFTIEITEEGTYLAVRNENPMFALAGKTIVEAAQRAADAFASHSYYQAKLRSEREGAIDCERCGGRGWHIVGLGGDCETCDTCKGFGRV